MSLLCLTDLKGMASDLQSREVEGLYQFTRKAIAAMDWMSSGSSPTA